MKTHKFYSHGKLLLTGEYLVLDGAKALAIPCKFGQHLDVTTSQSKYSTWVSYDYQDRLWLEVKFDLQKVISDKLIGENEVETRLFQIFRALNQLNPKAFSCNYQFQSNIEFPNNWGLGTSSTLIANLAKWAEVNPYELLNRTFGGSGYDIACATSDSALVYDIKHRTPNVETTSIPDVIKPYLYFVHLEQKQNSRDAIANYRNIKPNGLDEFISEINLITDKFQKVQSLNAAHKLITQHENILSEILKIQPVQSRLFPDFIGSIKSLGAWGGDFILVLSDKNPKYYFQNKGYNCLLTYKEMAL